MGFSAWLRRRPRILFAGVLLAAGAVAVTTLAFAAEGEPTTQVDLNDGSVWVTNESALMVGHFNDRSRVLDGGLHTTSDDYDVLQSGDTVLVHDRAGDTLAPADVARVAMTGSVDLPAGAQVALGGQTVAVLDAAKGRLWVMPARAAGSFRTATAPVATLGAGAAVAVGTDGTVHAVAPAKRRLVTVTVDAQGAPDRTTQDTVDTVRPGDDVAVTAVGTDAVILDRTRKTLFSPAGATTHIDDAADAQVAQPAGAGDAVYVATRKDLVRVPLRGGDVSTRSSGGEGVPAAPVALGGCVYGAWAGSARFVRDCPGTGNDLVRDIPGVDGKAQLVFRQNRDVVVLNDVVGGSAWVATDALQQVDDWESLTPPKGDATEEEDEVTEESVQSTLPKRTAKNTPPIANPDSYGVRAGRTTVLPVLENDTDADGDVLTVTVPGGNPRLGTLQTTNNGSGLQIVVPSDASGSASFTYRVDDGRGGHSQARVSLTVHPDDVNAAPEQRRITSLQIETGGVLTYDILPDWRDPDGDELFLKSAEAAPGDEADVSPDGRITYRATSGTLGRKDVKVYVSDGDKVTQGTVRFDVRPRGSTDPVTTADHVIAHPGVPVTVSPVANDYTAGTEELRLTRVVAPGGATVKPDYANKRFSFTAASAGTYYVQYLVAAGTATADGIVRVDVEPAVDSDAAPVAVQDTALLPTGGDTLVNVLANDSDPAGGILVVQSVQVSDDAGVSVAVLGHATVRVTDQGSLSQQVTLTYTVSNGHATAEGQVVVVPVPAPTVVRPPSAQDDTAVVRAGDVVTIPVLDNDTDPNGGTLHVAPDLVAPLPAASVGQAFVSQDTVRFKAGNKPGTAHLTYEAVGGGGQKDAAYVTVQILPVDVKTNQAPQPQDLTARVLVGSTVRIPVPLSGIDPDGDSVQLVGLASAPSQGRVTATGPDWIDYEAVAGVGTDRFTYRVRDRLGREGVGSVQVGVAPASDVNQAPYAVKDSIAMRPGRTVAVPVMANDSDPDGDRIGLVSDAVTVPDIDGLAARVSGDRLLVTAPDHPVHTSVQYTIRDDRGARAVGVLQISVQDDVPLRRPIARDDRVAADRIHDGRATVPVLANDEDPDGTVDALKVAVDADDVTVGDGGRVTVPVGGKDRLITYTITDQDELTASAFIWVPAVGSQPPVLSSTTPVKVKSGQTVQIPLKDHVRVFRGAGAQVTRADRVSAVHGNGDELVKDAHTLVYTSADRYAGPDAITVEVTDGSGPDDPHANTATVVIPITVVPPDNVPPTFTDGQVTVAPGEKAASLDLRALTKDLDDGDLDHMTYTVSGGVPAGLTVTVHGQSLQAEAAASTSKGTTATVHLQISDGHNPPVDGEVAVTVTASTRPLATANDDVVAEAHQGDTVRVDVLANDVNPFPDTPLKLTAAAVESGDGAVEVAGDHLQITPGKTFSGRLTVRYRVQDATKDVDREVEGRVLVTVQGVPDAPGRPTVSSVQDRTVVLSWTPPVDNGAEITSYTVKAVGGGYERSCAATTCTLDKLTNNVEYTFTVTATNRVGDSPASAASETARPDARPDTPVAPTLKYKNQALGVTWVTPSTPGSPVESYNLEISPAPPSGLAQKTKVTGNSLTWTGLENGTAYRVRVQAVNRAPEPSMWSPWSATEIPARAPDAPAKPATAELSPVGSQAQMNVTWKAPADNGDAVSGYQLAVIHGSSTVNTYDLNGATTTSKAVNVATSTTAYTYKVRAHNKAGWGAWSPVSAARRGVIAPGAPGKPTVTVGDRKVTVKYAAATAGGATSGELHYEYRLNSGAWKGSWSSGGGTVTGLANGTSYTVTVRAVSVVSGQTYAGKASAASAAVKPYGKPNTPAASAKASGTKITYHWTVPASNGLSVKVRYRIDGGGWSGQTTTGSTTKSYGYSQTHKIEVQAVDSKGQTSAIASASAKTAAKPKPTAVLVKGAKHNSDTCGSQYCRDMNLKVSNFPAGNYVITCHGTGPYGGDWGGWSRSVPADGTISSGCYFGGSPGEKAWLQIDGWGTTAKVTW